MHTRRIKNTICKAQPDEPDPYNEVCASHFITYISVCNAIRLAEDSKCKTVFSEQDFNPTLHRMLHYMCKTLTPRSVPMMLWALAQCHAEGHDIVDFFVFFFPICLFHSAVEMLLFLTLTVVHIYRNDNKRMN